MTIINLHHQISWKLSNLPFSKSEHWLLNVTSSVSAAPCLRLFTAHRAHTLHYWQHGEYFLKNRSNWSAGPKWGARLLSHRWDSCWWMRVELKGWGELLGRIRKWWLGVKAAQLDCARACMCVSVCWCVFGANLRETQFCIMSHWAFSETWL